MNIVYNTAPTYKYRIIISLCIFNYFSIEIIPYPLEEQYNCTRSKYVLLNCIYLSLHIIVLYYIFFRPPFLRPGITAVMSAKYNDRSLGRRVKPSFISILYNIIYTYHPSRCKAMRTCGGSGTPRVPPHTPRMTHYVVTRRRRARHRHAYPRRWWTPPTIHE